jgi:hypothetical protein
MPHLAGGQLDTPAGPSAVVGRFAAAADSPSAVEALPRPWKPACGAGGAPPAGQAHAHAPPGVPAPGHHLPNCGLACTRHKRREAVGCTATAGSCSMVVAWPTRPTSRWSRYLFGRPHSGQAFPILKYKCGFLKGIAGASRSSNRSLNCRNCRDQHAARRFPLALHS